VSGDGSRGKAEENAFERLARFQSSVIFRKTVEDVF